MELHMTEAAIDSLRSKLGDLGFVKLVYDSEGCGCADNGVPGLWLVDRPAPFDVPIITNAPFPVIIDNHQTMYFESVMRLDVQSSGYFRLSSNQQIYTTHLASVDKRSAL